MLISCTDDETVADAISVAPRAWTDYCYVLCAMVCVVLYCAVLCCDGVCCVVPCILSFFIVVV